MLRKDACILWKPPGWTASVGSFEGEEEEELKWRAGQTGRPLQDWVLETLGPRCPVVRDEKADFGLVHRLDRDTSGPILCAKTYRGFHSLQLCLVRFKARKDYVCLCQGFLEAPRVLDTKLRVDGSGPSRRSVIGSRGQRAILEVLEASHLCGPDGAAASLVRVRLRTGRMHQIRAQLSSLGHPLFGDALYGLKGRWSACQAWLPRIFLHASSLEVSLDDDLLRVDCGLPRDLQEALRCCVPLNASARAHRDHWLEKQGDAW